MDKVYYDQPELLKLIINSTQGIIWAIDTNYCLLFANNEFQNAMIADGVEKMIIGQYVLSDEYPKEFIDFWGNNFQKCFAEGKLVVESETARKNGIHYFENSLNTIIAANGSVIGLVVITIDITERKRTEEKLKESELKWRTLFNILPVGVTIHDPQNNISEFNPAMGEILEISEEGVRNKQYTQRNYFHSDFREMKPSDFPSNLALKYNKCFQNIEVGIEKEDKSIIWTEVSAAPLPYKNNMCVIVISDITIRKQAESALRQSEQKYKNLIENSGTGILIVNREGVYEFVNEKAANQFGLTSMEIVGKSIFDLLPNPKALQYIESNASLIDSGGHREYEDTFILNGQLKTFLIIDQCIKDTNGRNYALQSSSIDISDRKHAEKALNDLNNELENRVLDRTKELTEAYSSLQLSEAKFKDLAELLPQAVYEADLKGQLNYANKQAFELFGYTPDDLKKGISLIDLIIPEEREIALKRMLDLKFKKNNPSQEYTALRKDGSIFNIILYSNIIIQNNQPIGFRGVGVDITELKQAEKIIKESEERLQRLIDSVTDYIYYVKIENGQTIETIHGKGCNSVTGYSKEEFENDGLLWFDIVHEDDKRIVKEQTQLILANQEPVPFEHRIIHKKGSVKWVRNTIVFHYDSNGILNGYDGLISDITQQKILEQQILNRVIETEEKERLYFSQELHDGVGPLLSAAKMYLQWLTITNDPKERGEIQKDLENLINESSRVIREISFKLSPHILQNYGLAEAIKAYVSKIEESSKIHFTLNIQQYERIQDKEETIIYRIVCECINNTIKHARASEIKINLYNKNNNLIIEYSDNGKGFDVHSALTSNKSIGLLNMQSRMKSINGDLSIQSEPNKGTFIVIQVREY